MTAPQASHAERRPASRGRSSDRERPGPAHRRLPGESLRLGRWPAPRGRRPRWRTTPGDRDAVGVLGHRDRGGGTAELPYQVQLHADAPAGDYAGWSSPCAPARCARVQSTGGAGADPAPVLRPADRARLRVAARPERVVTELDRQRVEPREEVPLALEIGRYRAPRQPTNARHHAARAPAASGTEQAVGQDRCRLVGRRAAALTGGFPARPGRAVTALHAVVRASRLQHRQCPSLDEFGSQVGARPAHRTRRRRDPARRRPGGERRRGRRGGRGRRTPADADSAAPRCRAWSPWASRAGGARRWCRSATRRPRSVSSTASAGCCWPT